MKVIGLRHDDVAPALLAATWFFLILCVNFLLRPVREAVGMEEGIDEVRILFVITMVVTLLANGGLGWLVGLARRRAIISTCYHFFALNLIAFYAATQIWPDSVGTMAGRVFYVWLSVYNLFAVALFWAFIVDRMGSEQVRRSAGVITMGGTIGAIVGSAVAWRIAEWASIEGSLLESLGGARTLLVLGALVLEIVIVVVILLDRGDRQRADVKEPVGGRTADAFLDIVTSRYLLGIACYVGFAAVVATLLYFTKLRIVADLTSDGDERTGIFANIDLLANIAVLSAQLLLTGRVMTRFGPAVALAVLPIVSGLGIGALWLVPAALLLPCYVGLEMATKAARYAFMRPGREVLFTVVDRSVKFRAKPFIDTFVYRLADVLGSLADKYMSMIAGAVAVSAVAVTAAVGVPVALAWAVLGIGLGRAADRALAERQEGDTDASDTT